MVGRRRWVRFPGAAPTALQVLPAAYLPLKEQGEGSSPSESTSAFGAEKEKAIPDNEGLVWILTFPDRELRFTDREVMLKMLTQGIDQLPLDSGDTISVSVYTGTVGK